MINHRLATIAFVFTVAVAVMTGSLWYLPGRNGAATSPDERARVVQAAVDQIDQRAKSPFQDELLRDGTLNEAEYDLAYERYSTCVVAAGGVITGPGGKTKRGIYDFTITVPPLAQGGANDSAIAAVAECKAQYFDVVGPRWSAMHMATRAESEAALAGVRGCAHARGLQLPSLDSTEEVLNFLESAPREDGQILAECLRAAATDLGVPSHTGVVGPIR